MFSILVSCVVCRVRVVATVNAVWYLYGHSEVNYAFLAYHTRLNKQRKDTVALISLMGTDDSGPISRSLVLEIRGGRLTRRDAVLAEWVAERVPDRSTQLWDQLDALAPRLNYALQGH